MDKFEKIFDMSFEKAMLFVAKPIVILIICKIVVTIVLKILNKIFE